MGAGLDSVRKQKRPRCVEDGVEALEAAPYGSAASRRVRASSRQVLARELVASIALAVLSSQSGIQARAMSSATVAPVPRDPDTAPL